MGLMRFQCYLWFPVSRTCLCIQRLHVTSSVLRTNYKAEHLSSFVRTEKTFCPSGNGSRARRKWTAALASVCSAMFLVGDALAASSPLSKTASSGGSFHSVFSFVPCFGTFRNPVVFGAVTMPSFVTGARRLPSRISRCSKLPESWRCMASDFTPLLTGRGPELTWPSPTRVSSCSR